MGDWGLRVAAGGGRDAGRVGDDGRRGGSGRGGGVLPHGAGARGRHVDGGRRPVAGGGELPVGGGRSGRGRREMRRGRGWCGGFQRGPLAAAAETFTGKRRLAEAWTSSSGATMPANRRCLPRRPNLDAQPGCIDRTSVFRVLLRACTGKRRRADKKVNRYARRGALHRPPLRVHSPCYATVEPVNHPNAPPSSLTAGGHGADGIPPPPAASRLAAASACFRNSDMRTYNSR